MELKMNKFYNESYFSEKINDIENINLDEVGVIYSAYDGFCIIKGLNNCFINEIVIFDNLEQEQIKLIIDKELQLFKNDLSNRNVSIKYSSEITDFIFNKIQFNNFGARQVIKTIQRELQTQVAEKMLDSTKKLNLEISVKDDNICVI